MKHSKAFTLSLYYILARVAVGSYQKHSPISNSVVAGAWAAKPQLAVPYGIPGAITKCNSKQQKNISVLIRPLDSFFTKVSLITCKSIPPADSWFLSPPATSLGIRNSSIRQNRILGSSQAKYVPGNHSLNDHGCDLTRHPWSGSGSENAPLPPFRWQWPSGPSSGPHVYLNKTGGYPLISPTEPLSVGTQFRAPGAASAQLPPPSLGAVSFGEALPMSLPERAAEPWTVEIWYVALPNPRQTSLVGNIFQLYSGSDGFSGLDVYAPAAAVRSGQGFNLQQLGSSMRIMSSYSRAQDSDAYCFYYQVVDCPRRMYSEACSPVEIPVDPADLCMQSTVWNTLNGKSILPPERMERDSVQNSSRCPARPPPTLANVSIDRVPPVRVSDMPNGVYRGTIATIRLVGGCTRSSVRLIRRPSGISAAAPSAVWQQFYATVFPPGTVAVVPFDGRQGRADSDPPRSGHASPKWSQYPWRVNRGPVVSLLQDVPPSTLGDLTKLDGAPDAAGPQLSSTCMLPVGTVPGLKLTGARPVLLSDASCVGIQSCLPRLSNWSSVGGPGDSPFQRDLTEYANSEAVVGLFPTARLGCAVSYDIDFSLFQSSGVPIDMPAAQNGAGFAIGGFSLPYAIDNAIKRADRGRWNQTNTRPHLVADTVSVSASQSKRNHVDSSVQQPAGRSKESSTGNMTWATRGVVIGPYLQYRGPVFGRVYPPDPKESLPAIAGGSWVCHRSSPYGAYRGRVACNAVCDDPQRLPIDNQVEDMVGSPSAGWSLAASIVRQWYSVWLGFPALLPQAAVYGNQRLEQVPSLGTVHTIAPNKKDVLYMVSEGPNGTRLLAPRMSCAADEPPSIRLQGAYKTRWAQRSKNSRAVVSFVIEVDRNSAPQAQSLAPSTLRRGQAPGLDYPSPSRAQREWFVADVRDDIRDTVGELWADSSRAWSIELVRVETPAPRQPPKGALLQVPVLSMRLHVRLTIPPAEIVLASNLSRLIMAQASMTGGAVGQRLAAALSGARAQAGVGTWLPYVDPTTVDLDVQLPCLHALGVQRSSACMAGGWFQFHAVQVGAIATGCFVLVVVVSALVACVCDGRSIRQPAERCSCALNTRTAGLRTRSAVWISRTVLVYVCVGQLYSAALSYPAIGLLVGQILLISWRLLLVLSILGILSMQRGCERGIDHHVGSVAPYLATVDDGGHHQGQPLNRRLRSKEQWDTTDIEVDFRPPYKLGNQTIKRQDDLVEAADTPNAWDAIAPRRATSRPASTKSSHMPRVNLAGMLQTPPSNTADARGFWRDGDVQRLSAPVLAEASRSDDEQSQQRSGASNDQSFDPRRENRVLIRWCCTQSELGGEKSTLGIDRQKSALSRDALRESLPTVGWVLMQVASLVQWEARLLAVSSLGRMRESAVPLIDRSAQSAGSPASDEGSITSEAAASDAARAAGVYAVSNNDSVRHQAARLVYKHGSLLRVFEDVHLLTCLVWAFQCSLSGCTVGACMLSNEIRDLGFTDQRLLLEQRVAIAGPTVLALLCSIVASIIDLIFTVL